jgi:leucyl-tRNA synthetase
MVAPLAPHVAEELWERIGHAATLAYEPFPGADPAMLVADEVEIPVQVRGRVRGHVRVRVDADEAEVEKAAREDPRIAELLAGTTVHRVVVVPGRLVNFVTD